MLCFLHGSFALALIHPPPPSSSSKILLLSAAVNIPSSTHFLDDMNGENEDLCVSNLVSNFELDPMMNESLKKNIAASMFMDENGFSSSYFSFFLSILLNPK